MASKEERLAKKESFKEIFIIFYSQLQADILTLGQLYWLVKSKESLDNNAIRWISFRLAISDIASTANNQLIGISVIGISCAEQPHFHLPWWFFVMIVAI